MVEPFLGLRMLGSLLNDPEPPIDWLVEGMIARAGVTFFVARPGAGKSLFAYYLSAGVLLGHPLFDALAVQSGAVAYIDLDMHRKGIAAMRAAAALRGIGATEAQLQSVPLYIAAQRASMDVRDRIVLDAVVCELRQIDNLALTVLDTFSDLHHGKEGSPDDMTDTVNGAVEIARCCACGVLVIHHQRKNGGTELEDVRGASSITSKADAVFILKPERDDEGNPGALSLLQRKARLTEEARPRHIALEADSDSDGTLRSYRYVTVETAGRLGRPPSASADAERIALRLLDAAPAMPKPELVRKLTGEGVAQATAYRVASALYQYPRNLGTNAF